MSRRNLQRLVGMFLIVDGILNLLFGRGRLRAWLFGRATKTDRQVTSRVVGLPNWLVRLSGAAEAGLGLIALRRVPVGVRELYHVLAKSYDSINQVWRGRLYHDAHLALDQAIAAHLPPGAHVLDLGCGTAANLERLVALQLPFGSYTGVDFSGDMLAQAKAKFANAPNVHFQQLNLMVDPLPEGPFDLVVSTWVFSHLPDPLKVVEKAWQRLSPGGNAVFLFLVDTGSLRDRLFGPVLRFFSTRPLPKDMYRRFPGLVSYEQFGEGAAGLAVLQKPEE